MPDETSHPISASFRRQNTLASVIGLVFAVGAAVWLIVDPTLEPGGRVLMGVLGLGTALGATWCAWFVATAARRTVVLRDDGLRVGDGNWIPWTAIAHVRPRGALQRADLVGHDERRLASIEYQIEGAVDIIGLAIERTRRAQAVERRLFGRRLRPVFIASAAASVIGTGWGGWWLWQTEGGTESAWLGLLVPLMFLGAMYEDLRKILTQLELRETELVLRTALRERVMPRQEISRVGTAFERSHGSEILTVAVERADGSLVKICPSGQDPQEVDASVASWLEARRDTT